MVDGKTDDVFLIKAGEHIICGVLSKVPDGLGSHPLPDGSTVSVLLQSPTTDSSVVRAPAFDARGLPKGSELHLVQYGAKRDVLKWKPQTGVPLPAARPTRVIRLACVRSLSSDKLWAERSKNIKVACKAWLAMLRVPQDDIIDFFRPQKSENGDIVSINVRVAGDHAQTIDRASGVQEMLARILPMDPKAPQVFGNVKWIKPQEGEAGSNLIARARLEAEKATVCLGLAFSNSGSVGLRLPAGPIETAWKVTGLPKSVSIPQFIEWLRAQQWPEICALSVRRRVLPSGASFIFRGTSPNGTFDAMTIETVSGDSPHLIDIEPFRPLSKPTAFKNLRNGDMSWADSAKPAANTRSAKVASNDIAVSQPREPGERAAKIAKVGENGSAMDIEVEPSAGEEVFTNLGLTIRSVPTDGACLFHSLGFWFKLAGRTAHNAATLRTQVAEHLVKRGKVYEPLWDRCAPDGSACASWNSYIEAIRQPVAWGGELELLAAADKWNLCIIVVRPDASTVVVGTGKYNIWLLLRNQHYEPLAPDTCTVHSAARKKHISEVIDAFRLGAFMVGPQRTWKLAGGGKSRGSSGSASFAIQSGSSSSAKTMGARNAPSQASSAHTLCQFSAKSSARTLR